MVVGGGGGGPKIDKNGRYDRTYYRDKAGRLVKSVRPVGRREIKNPDSPHILLAHIPFGAYHVSILSIVQGIPYY